MARVHELVRPEIPAIEPGAEAEAEAQAEAELDNAIDTPVVTAEPDEPDDPDGSQGSATAPVTSAASPARATIEPGELASLMSQIEIRPLDDGRVAIELPRPAAAALGGLLRALAAAVEGTPAVQ